MSKSSGYRSTNWWWGWGPILIGLCVLAVVQMAWFVSLNAYLDSVDLEPPILDLTPIVVADSALYWAGKYGIDVDLARDIMSLAEEYGFDKELVFSVIQTESSFRQEAVSPVGAIGYMQVMPATARHYQPGITVEGLFDRETNIRIGLSYLRDMLDEFGTIERALVAYNAGPSRARRILDKHGTDVYYVRAVLND